MAVGVFVDMRGRKVFSFGWWGTRGWLEIVDEMLRRMGDRRGDGGEVGSHWFAEFLPCIPLSLAPWQKKKKKNPLSLKTHYSSIGLLEKKRERGEGLIW